MSGQPLSRAAIAAMSDAEFSKREGEIARWVRAGAVDGQDVTPLERPAGHEFTRAEIAAMSDAEFIANEAAITAQAAAIGAR